MQKIVTVNNPSTSMAAVVGQQVTALSDAGIRSRVRASTRVDGGVTLRVSEDDLDTARDILDASNLLSS